MEESMDLNGTQYVTKCHKDVTEEVGGEGGNTSSPSRLRRVCFTLNNYTEEEASQLKIWLAQKTQYYIMGWEIGKEGTPHLQGYFEVKNAIRFDTLKELNNRVHWERAIKKRIFSQNYCSKDGNYICSIEIRSLGEILKQEMLDRYVGIVWKPWQQTVLDKLNGEPDSRTINWICDWNGNSGKSYLTKYLALTRELIIADGKKDNIFNQVNRKLNEEEKEFQLVVLDIPRSGEGYVNYGVLEQLKNGLIYSGKYEGGLCLFDNVHVIVFANFMPDKTQFSEDRWNIIDITEE